MRPPAMVDSLVRWQASTVPARVLATVASTVPRSTVATSTGIGFRASHHAAAAPQGQHDGEDQAAAQPAAGGGDGHARVGGGCDARSLADPAAAGLDGAQDGPVRPGSRAQRGGAPAQRGLAIRWLARRGRPAARSGRGTHWPRAGTTHSARSPSRPSGRCRPPGRGCRARCRRRGRCATPPHVAVAPARQRGVGGLGELRLVAALADVVDDRLGHDLLAVEAAVVAHHLAEARQVAPGVQAPPANFRCPGRRSRSRRPARHRACSRCAPAGSRRPTCWWCAGDDNRGASVLTVL